MLKKILFIVIVTASFLYSQNNDDANRFMLGQSYLQSGELSRARDIFNELYSGNPSNPQYFQSLIDVLVKLKEYESSVKLIEQRIAVTPQDINLYGMLGSTYYLLGNEEKAFSVWDDALKKSGNTISYRVIANYAIERRAFDKAIDLMQKGKTISEDPSIFSFDLAHLYIMTMGFKEAAEELCLVLSQNPNQLNAVESRIFSYVNKPDALTQTITVLEECKSEDISFSYLLARLYQEQKNYAKAYDLYKEIDAKQGSQGAELFNFAQMVFNDREYKTASEVFGDIIEKYPNSPFVSTARLGYAKTTEALISTEIDSLLPSWKPYYSTEPNSSGRIEEVISAYNDVARVYPHSDIANEALLRIGSLKLYFRNDPAGAKEYFLRIINNSPGSNFTADAYYELAGISLLGGKLDEAGSFLERIISNRRAGQEKINLARYKLANVHFYKGDFNRSKELLTAILGNLKDNTANDAIELSLLLNTTMNDSSNLITFAEGELLAGQKNFEQAKAKYRQIEQNPKGFMLVHLSKIRAAEMTLAQDSLETSVVLFSKIADEKEKNIYADKALYLLGKIYQFGINNPAKAVEIYESLLAKFPNSLYLDEAREAIMHLRNKLS
ncbi:MAG: tetratricopeptide repeat protein [Ignavibacteriaceae bacterium]